MQRLTGPSGKFKHFVMTEYEYKTLCDNQEGLCYKCGYEVDGVEPDATHYTCEDCETPSVFGTEQLLLMGRIVFSNEEAIDGI